MTRDGCRKPKPTGEAQKRPCMRCKKAFLSYGPFHRFCPRCQPIVLDELEQIPVYTITGDRRRVLPGVKLKAT